MLNLIEVITAIAAIAINLVAMTHALSGSLTRRLLAHNAGPCPTAGMAWTAT